MKTRSYIVVGLIVLVALVPTTASAAVAPPTPTNNTLLITASIPTSPTFNIVAQFRCAPGTVTSNTDFTLATASPFDTTTISASASVGDTTVPNVCSNSLTANLSQIAVTTTGSDGVDTVQPGGATTLGGITQSAAVPGSVFVAGYNLGFLTVGENQVAANVQTKIEATNTVQGTQTTNLVGGNPPNGTVFVTTTITDPDGSPGTADEFATPGSFSVTYNDLLWTAGPSGAINYRQGSIVPVTVADDPIVTTQPKKKKCKKGQKLKKGKCVKKKKKKKKK
ncbi:MAG: hypothetical protein ACXWF9_04825 [Solirubrobacterales bacterium]